MRPIQLLFPDLDTFRHALESPRAPWLVTAFLIGLGSLYGLFVAIFQRAIGGEYIPGYSVDAIPLYLIIIANVIPGIVIMILAHIGVTFVTWLMARAVGGPGHLTALYRTTAYLLPLFLPAIPLVAAASAAAALGEPAVGLPLQALYLPLAILAAALFLNGLYALLRAVQDVSPIRAGIATAGFVIFVSAILIIA